MILKIQGQGPMNWIVQLITKRESGHGDIPFIMSMASNVPVEELMDPESGDGR